MKVLLLSLLQLLLVVRVFNLIFEHFVILFSYNKIFPYLFYISLSVIGGSKTASSASSVSASSLRV